MLFNSLEFTIFLPIVFLIYWLIPKEKIQVQNFFLLCSSYFFYGWWDERFLALILFSSLLDFFLGRQIHKSDNNSVRKRYVMVSMFVNLGFLAYFKYYNFFIDSFVDAFSLFGQSLDYDRLSIILPVGISFYTFQTLSYSIDIYRKKIEPAKNWISLFAFVSFFPQLVAGPIERAKNLLPQFEKVRSFNHKLAADGLRQILWGLFKKVVIADNCAIYANEIFNNSGDYSGSTLLLGAVFFAFQIYGDFSGYSDIAIGTARLFGFNLMKNFNFPYFSRDIAEFWRRWHISLSTWFRDYVYIPLGGSKGSKLFQFRNVMVIFLVSGFWHGANWTFILWGLVNALLFIPLLFLGRNRKNTGTVAEGKFLPNVSDMLRMLSTFFVTTIAWVIFRAENINHAFQYIKDIFSAELFSMPVVLPLYLIILIFFFVGVEWLGREKEFALDFNINSVARPLRWSSYLLLVFMIYRFGASQQDFIYFQF